MLFALLACQASAPSDSTGDSATDYVDARMSEDDLGELTDADLVWEGPDVVIDPGTDAMWCQYGTYDGPDVGLHHVHTYQGVGGHHFVVFGTTVPELDVPDGTVVACSGGEFDMTDAEPFAIANEITVNGTPGEYGMPLLDGMAVELESGQRYIMQSHYLNTTSDPIRVRDLAVLSTVPPEEVETWAATFIMNSSKVELPPNQSTTHSFDCTVDEADGWNMIYMLGHMHEWGSTFDVSRVEGEVRTSLYNVPEWDPTYRDAPPINFYGDAPLDVPDGATYRTTCEWYNDTDATIAFPSEMCVTVSIVYPQKSAVICDEA